MAQNVVTDKGHSRQACGCSAKTTSITNNITSALKDKEET